MPEVSENCQSRNRKFPFLLECTSVCFSWVLSVILPVTDAQKYCSCQSFVVKLTASCQKYDVINWHMNQSVDISDTRLFLSLHTMNIICAIELVVLLLRTWEVMGQVSVFVPVFSSFMQILGQCFKPGHKCYCPQPFNLLVSLVTIEFALVQDITPGFSWSLTAWFLWFILLVARCMKIMMVSHVMSKWLVIQ